MAKASKKAAAPKKAAAKAAPKKAAAAPKKAAPAKKAAAPKKAAPKAAAKKAAPAKKAAAKKAAPAKKAARKPNAAFMAALTPDAALGAVIGAKPVPRTEIIKKIWDYIRSNNLQDQKNKRMINADAKLKVLFGGKSQISMFELAKVVSGHVS
jgi:upstream activation factor subunit UAF30